MTNKLFLPKIVPERWNFVQMMLAMMMDKNIGDLVKIFNHICDTERLFCGNGTI